MKFIHAGDLHLGNSFLGLHHMPYWVNEKLKQASTIALERLIQDAISEAVDLVIFPGDLYDTTHVNLQTQLKLKEAIDQLNQANIRVAISFGNHDFMIDTRQKKIFANDLTYVFDENVDTFYFDTVMGEHIAISGFSYGQRHISKRMVGDFPHKKSGETYHIGLYHGEQATGETAQYAPFTLSELNQVQYDYWGLGHIHIRQTLQQTPFVGYSGNLQGLNRQEVGPKGYYMVESIQGLLVPTFTAVAPVEWSNEQIKQAKPVTLSSLFDQIEHLIEADTDAFQLITLTIETNDKTIQSLVKNGQLLEQIQSRSNPVDKRFIYRIQVKTDEQDQLPLLPKELWSATEQDIFTFEQLQQLGLKAVTDTEILNYFMDPQTMITLQQSVRQSLEILDMEDR